MMHACLALDLPSGRVLGAEFFARPSDLVARDLIGKVIWRAGVGGGRLSEVEAYLPEDDPACHAAKGLTRRNSAMFGAPGTIYVFQSYGVHYLLNLVCDGVGIGSAVLVRSLAPLEECGPSASGASERPSSSQASVGAVGPGVVGRVLGVGPALNGLALGESSGVFVLDDGACPPVGVTVRVGISRGSELPLRYYMAGTRYVSRLPKRERGEVP